MRNSTGAFVCALALGVLAFPAARADAAFTDIVCPEATQYVVAMGALKQSDPPQRVYDAANAAATAYELCAKRQLADANVEPGVHYAYTREAGLAIVAARALVALNRQSDAKAMVLNAKRLAQDVVDWRRSIQQNGAIIRLADVADVVLGAEDYDAQVRFQGEDAVFMGITPLPNANSIDVINGIRREMDGIQKELPSEINGGVAYDATEYINAAIRDVVRTLLTTLAIVMVVINAWRVSSVRSSSSRKRNTTSIE